MCACAEAENQAFKVPYYFGTFAWCSLLHIWFGKVLDIWHQAFKIQQVTDGLTD